MNSYLTIEIEHIMIPLSVPLAVSFLSPDPLPSIAPLCFNLIHCFLKFPTMKFPNH